MSHSARPVSRSPTMPKIALSALSATPTLVASTGPDDVGVAVNVITGGSLGGGTLTLSYKSVNETGDPETLDATLIVGSQYRYDAGGRCQYYLALTGATAPSGNVRVELVPA